jgi:ADP-ribosyltransferase exoenzyme
VNEDRFFEEILPKASPFVERFRDNDVGYLFSTISDREIRSVYFYTTENETFSYLAINPLLAAGTFNTSDIKYQIQSIDSCLEKLSPYIGPLVRTETDGGWMHKKIDLLLELSNTAVKTTTKSSIEYVSNEFFMSTTLRPIADLSNASVIFLILSKYGGRNISDFSAFPEEKEVLFKRNSQFIIVSVDDSIKNRVVVTLAEVQE